MSTRDDREMFERVVLDAARAFRLKRDQQASLALYFADERLAAIELEEAAELARRWAAAKAATSWDLDRAAVRMAIATGADPEREEAWARDREIARCFRIAIGHDVIAPGATKTYLAIAPRACFPRTLELAGDAESFVLSELRAGVMALLHWENPQEVGASQFSAEIPATSRPWFLDVPTPKEATIAVKVHNATGAPQLFVAHVLCSPMELPRDDGRPAGELTAPELAARIARQR